METEGDPWRPGRNKKDQAETHAEQGRPPETGTDHWRPADTPGHQVRQAALDHNYDY